MPERTIVLGSGNAAKREQLRWLLEGLPLVALQPASIAVDETAEDLEGNARLKALAHSARGLAIASDGGLELPGAAGRWDPVLTQRMGQAGLRRVVSGIEKRTARWREAAAIADRGRLLVSWTESGTEGVLAPEPWPEPGDFWVWDIFVFPDLGKRWAHLTPAERLQVDVTWSRLKEHVRAFFANR